MLTIVCQADLQHHCLHALEADHAAVDQGKHLVGARQVPAALEAAQRLAA